MKEKIANFNDKLISFIDNEGDSIPLGLCYGKMGLCLYFSILARSEKNISYNKVAYKLREDIINNINRVNSVDVISGLGGIGLGMNYLFKHKYLFGNANYILSDIDDTIFKFLSSSQNISQMTPLLLIQGLYYFGSRLNEFGLENKKIYQGIIIELLNMLDKNINYGVLNESTLFYNIFNYHLPRIIYIYKYIYSLDFYNYRIDKILDTLINTYCGIMPQLNCNKLRLLWILTEVNNVSRKFNCERYIKLLKNDIDFNCILKSELKDKNIFFEDGLTSIYLLSYYLRDYYLPFNINSFREQVKERIENSTIWKGISLKENQSFFTEHVGLLNGFSGTILTLYKTF